MAGIKHNIKNMKKYRFLLMELIKKGIVLKYRRSFFGILWSLFEPLLTMIVMAYVFSTVFDQQIEFFAIYILCGRLIFTLFQSTTKEALKSVRSNAAMIKKVYVPKYMYPLSATLYNFVLFIISLIDLVFMMLWVKVPPTWCILEGFVPIIVMLVFSVGVGLILATVNVFFRDIEYLWNVATLLIMYCSAIFYDVSKLEVTNKAWILKVNPVYLMIKNFRNTVIYGKHLEAESMLIGTAAAIVSVIIGVIVFYKKQDDFILHI